MLTSLGKIIDCPSNRILTTQVIFSGKQSLILKKLIPQLSIMLPSMDGSVLAIVCCK